MNLHEQQQFDFLLATAVERYVERLEQRNEGAENALRRLREDPEGEGIWLGRFTEAIFQDFLLDNPAGCCFVLTALARRPAAFVKGGTVAEVLSQLAKAAFAELLRRKTEEVLEQHVGYQAMHA
jgi:hypothetical protein